MRRPVIETGAVRWKRTMLPLHQRRCLFCGDGGHRSHCLAHAKRALYHLSYTPLSPHADLNHGPFAYKASALPLSYEGFDKC